MSGPALLDKVAPGDHVCWIVDDDGVRDDAVAAFLLAGLRARHKVVYSGDAPGRILDALRERGADPAGPLRSGSLTVDTPQASYLASGVFDPEATVQRWQAEADLARHQGYLGLRVLGDMSWARREVPGSERLGWYETHINTVFTDGFVAGVCAYDRRLFDPLDLRRYTWSHPGTATTGMPYDPATSLRLRRTADGLTLSGEADRSNRTALAVVVEHLCDRAGPGQDVVIDVRDLRFADTAVARILVHAATAAPGRVRLAGCSPSLRRLLAFTGAAETPRLIVEQQ
nr:MEDS domain-containing protein [uncultured Actinoplanes sp.]